MLASNIVLFFLRAPARKWLLGIVIILAVIAFLIIFLSPKPRNTTEIVGRQKRVDERDIVFARFDLKEGAETFRQYYQRKPEYQKIDDEIRKFPDILTAPHLAKSPEIFSLAAAEFDFLEQQLGQVSGEVKPVKIERFPEENARIIKEITRSLGPDLCGISHLNQANVYSHVGRGPETYGAEINLPHKFAISFAVEMDWKAVSSAPHPPVILETAKKYVEAANVAIILARFIRHLGYSARAHIAGSNYQAMLPPLAWEAGLGELGRLGYIITSKYGPRARLGLVTTDLPLMSDKPVIMGVQNFCEKCQKCARCCPAQAIPFGEKAEENGVLKWAIDREKCYKYWRKVGTDCAICMSVCPYSHPDNLFHKIIRCLTSRSSLFQTLAIWGDDFFYGKKPELRNSPKRLKKISGSIR